MKKYSNRTVIESLDLPMLSCFDDLVKELRLSDKLVYWLTKQDADGKYKTFYVQKNNGKKREINAPVTSLKIVQRWLLEKILYKIRASRYSYGFMRGERKGSPLVHCAEKHKESLYVLKMDLKDFYPSITREKVYYVFSNIGYNMKVSNLLTNICVADNKLPQGAVTSPYIANLICRKMDFRIAGYCNKRDIVYTRYADDLTFSCDNRDILRNIYGMIKKIVEDEGFVLNKEKTLFLTPKNHKVILGVTVNDGALKASRVIKKNIRAMLHYEVATGDYTMNDKIRGYIAYVDSIEKGYRKKCIGYLDRLSKSTLSLFPDIVEAYNANKIYKELPDMMMKQAADFVKDDEERADFEDMIFFEHEEFLISHGLKD